MWSSCGLGNRGITPSKWIGKLNRKGGEFPFLLFLRAGWKILEVGIVVVLLGDDPKQTGDPFPLLLSACLLSVCQDFFQLKPC